MSPQRFETLEPRRLFAADPLITEFVASNGSSLTDGFGNDTDWIELHNAGDTAVDLADYHLTDDAGNPTQWGFGQSTVLNPGDYLVVFASGLDTVDPQGNLHTNFRLGAGGEHLALTDPDGNTVSSFGNDGADYPEQIRDVSYGRSGSNLVSRDSLATYALPFSDPSLNWARPGFDPAADGRFTDPLPASIGYEDAPSSENDFGAVIGFPVFSGLTAVYQRVEFSVADASEVLGLQLTMQSDDGFVAYLNGTRVAELNAPADLNPDSVATGGSPDQLVLEGFRFNLDAFTGLLRDGTNVLAIHALNVGPNSSDFLSVPTLDATLANAGVGYLAEPTPRAANGQLVQLGPAVTLDEPADARVRPNQSLTVTGTVAPFAGVDVQAGSARIHYRTAFGAETVRSLTLNADGGFSFDIPASAFVAGQQTRWYVTATDTNGVEGRGPRFLDPTDSPEYVGVVAVDDTIDTDLRLIQWFVQDEAGAQTDAGARSSVLIGSRFYDNVQTDIHGQSTRGPRFDKKSFDFDANAGRKFELFDEGPAVSDFNLLTNFADETKLRHSVANFAFRESGGAHLLAEPVTVYRNGEFYGLYDLVEDGDAEYLERLGLDPDNPLYKVNNPLDDAFNNVSKESRRFEGFDDLEAFVEGTRLGRTTAGRTWDYDNLDLASWVNLAAVQTILNNGDYGHKNQFLYRDTSGTGQWSLLPWDLDLSLGHRFSRDFGYFEDALRTTDGFPQTLNDILRRQHLENPRFRAMFEQRTANLLAQLYGAPGTSTDNSVVGREIDRLRGLIADEAVRDAAEWGRDPAFSQTPAQAAQELLDRFLPERRNYLQQRLPSAQSGDPGLRFGTEIDSGENFAEQFLSLTNPTGVAVDLSGWSLTGGVQHTFPAGTVIAPNDTLYVAADVQGFLNRTSGPRGGQQRFVQGNFEGVLDNNGEQVRLTGPDGTATETLTLPDTTPDPNLDQLRVTEVHYNPADGGAEFIELTNVGAVDAIDLSGVVFAEGPADPFVFTNGATLAAGQSIVLTAANDAAAFAATYPGVNPAGFFTGGLSNGGETLTFTDAGGQTVLSFAYDDAAPWPESPDGDGLSLTLIDPGATPIDQHGDPARWRASLAFGGTPGTLDDAAPTSVAGRFVFYNNASGYGTDGALPSDAAALAGAVDGAIAPDKRALRPGETASYANYTSFVHGVNGLVIDLDGAVNPTALDAEDFVFATGNGSLDADFTEVSVEADVRALAGAGADGATRVVVTLPDGTAAGEWLRVTLRAGADTGLPFDDVFYFGNAPGETGNSTDDAAVNLLDLRAVLQNRRSTSDPAPIDNAYDFNRDRRVNLLDLRATLRGRTNSQSDLNLISPPALELITAPNGGLLAGQAERAAQLRAAASYVQWQQTLAAADDADDAGTGVS